MAKGKRAGARPARRFRSDVMGLAIGITLLIVAWGYLVYTAIDFGGSARDGQPNAWLFLALAAIGAIACLFAGLLLIARLYHRLTTPPADPAPPTATSNRHRAEPPA